MTLPFLILPLVVQQIVLQNCDFVGLFDFSRISRRMKRIVLRDVKIRGHTMIIDVSSDVWFEFERTNDETSGGCITVEDLDKAPNNRELTDRPIGTHGFIGSCFNTIRKDRQTIKTYWNDVFAGATEVYKEILDLFKIPIKMVAFCESLDQDREDFEMMMTWINGIATNVPELFWTGQVSVPLYTWIMERVEPFSYVRFGYDPDGFFANDTMNLKVKRVAFRDGSFIRLSHLQSIGSSDITIEKTSLTNRDINAFFLYLQRGGSPQLKKLDLGVLGPANLDIVFEDLNAVESSANNWNFVMIDGKQCTVQYANYQGQPGYFRFIAESDRSEKNGPQET